MLNCRRVGLDIITYTTIVSVNSSSLPHEVHIFITKFGQVSFPKKSVAARAWLCVRVALEVSPRNRRTPFGSERPVKNGEKSSWTILDLLIVFSNVLLGSPLLSGSIQGKHGKTVFLSFPSTFNRWSHPKPEFHHDKVVKNMQKPTPPYKQNYLITPFGSIP